MKVIRYYNLYLIISDTMQFWQTVTKTAVRGTDKIQISADDIPAGPLKAAAEHIALNAAKDREEQFLQLAALTFNYRQCGGLPLKKELTPDVAPPETFPYCSDSASLVLSEIIDEESIPLITYWIKQCYKHHLI